MQYANGLNFDLIYTRMYSSRMNIGERLDWAMQEAKIASQSALARKSGVPQPTINRILKGGGKKGPESDTIKKLALAVNVSFDWLNEGKGDPGRAASAPKAIQAANDSDITADEILDLISAYKDASPEDRAGIMASAKTAAKRAIRRRVRSAASNQL